MGRPDLKQPNQAQVQPVGYINSGTMRKMPQDMNPNSGAMRKLPQDMNQNSSTMRKLAPNVPPGGVNFQNLWSSGLFDCMNDGENAMITCLVPCITFGQIAEIIDEGNTPCATSGLLYGLLFAIALPCVYSCMFRTKMRNKFGLPEDPAPDWITHFCFEYCALCQVYRELKHRGFDPNIGWNGNVQARQQQEMMAPPTSQRMRSLG